MLDIKSYSQIKISSERNFGIVFTVFFAVLCIFFWLNNNSIYFIFLILSIITIFLTLLIPKSLRLPNILWNKLSILLGTIVSPLIMAMIFFVTIVPTLLTIILTHALKLLQLRHPELIHYPRNWRLYVTECRCVLQNILNEECGNL